jgi:hypothetical protein
MINFIMIMNGYILGEKTCLRAGLGVSKAPN